MKVTTTKSNLFLYLACSLIWGSTWLAITYQIDSVSPLTAVFYRFVISSGVLFLLHAVLKRTLAYPRSQHLIFFFQGTCNFSLNYILTYTAEIFTPSAMVAVVFTTLVHMNILGTWYFFKKPITKNVIFGALFGMIGISFLFYQDLREMKADSKMIWGIGLALVATAFASAGNLLSYKNHLKKVPVMASNAWGMFYGMLSTGFLTLIFNHSFSIPMTLKFWSALLYLSIVGTVIAFGCYLTLVGRIGAEKASYTTVISPVVAVMISAVYENLVITPFLMTGILFCLMGNVLTLYKNKEAVETTADSTAQP